MTDMTNPYPSWGESGESPPNGFFYEQGDQVNEKHLDYLWAQAEAQTEEFIDAIEKRVNDLHGYVILDDGMQVSTGSATREVDITGSVDGAYVDGQFTGGTATTTLTLSSNSTGSERTDVVWVDKNGNIGKTEGTNVTPADKITLAEVDVADGGGITEIRQRQQYHKDHIASDTAPSSPTPGDLWHDTSTVDDDLKVYENNAWRDVMNNTHQVTVDAGDGLKDGGSMSLQGGSVTLNIEPADFAGNGLQDDGSDNLKVNASTTDTTSAQFTRLFTQNLLLDAPDPDAAIWTDHFYGLDSNEKVDSDQSLGEHTWVSSIVADEIILTNITYDAGFDSTGSDVYIFDLEQNAYINVGNMDVTSQGDDKTFSFSKRRIGGVRIRTRSDTDSSESAAADQLRVREYTAADHTHDIQP